MPLDLPRSQAKVDAIQARRKRLAVERARQSPLLAPRLQGIDLDRLDDPAEWRKIPLLTRVGVRSERGGQRQRDVLKGDPA